MANKKNTKEKKERKAVVIHEGPVKKFKILSWMLIATGLSTIIYLILFFSTNIFTFTELDLFYSFRSSFTLGGIWLVIMSVTAGVQLMLKKEDCLVYGILTGGTLVFGGLISTHFYIARNIYNHPGFAMGFETFAILFSLIFGGYIAGFLWNSRDHILEHKDMGPGLPKKKKR